MKIGVIGAGNVGGTLGRGWARKGHEVMFGVRDPLGSKMADLLAEVGHRAKAGSIPQTAAFGDVVALATPWSSTKEAIEKAGDLSGKVLLDCTNPLSADFSGLEIGHTTSGGEKVASWARNARVVKIFNTTGFANMAEPVYGGIAASMFLCGNDEEARGIAARLAKDLGFDPVDVGALKEARLLEPLAMLWIHLALERGMGREIAFALLRR